MDKKLIVEKLEPPLFTRTGIYIEREEAWKKGYWYPQFNIWIITKSPEPSIIYQKRSPDIGWAPNKLDVAIGGHYEDIKDYSRAFEIEAEEEIGEKIKKNDCYFIGKKVAANKGAFDNTNRNVVIDIYIIETKKKIEDFKALDKQEIYGLTQIKISDLIKLYNKETESFKHKIYLTDGSTLEDIVTIDSFPENWDNYQRKMVFLIDKYLKGEKNIEY